MSAQPSALAATGSCGQPLSNGANPLASDALQILRTAVGTAMCGGCSPCVCDVDSSGAVTASDALRVLQRAVGSGNNLVCTCPTGPGCGLAGLDQDCLDQECAAELACDATGYDFESGSITAATCHVRCGVDADCDPDEQCRPSTVGFFDIQRDQGGEPIECNLDSAPDGCDAAAGFACTRLTAGDVCAREFSACGTPVPMADRTGPDTITPEMWCNSGQPVELPEVGIVGGSRFCDRLDSLANPPVTVACQPVDDTHPPGLGVCAARCEQDDGKLTDCPDEMHCSTDRDESRFGTLLPDPTNTEFGVKDCATADDCGDSRFLCEQFAAGKFCYRPFATCSYAVP